MESCLSFVFLRRGFFLLFSFNFRYLHDVYVRCIYNILVICSVFTTTEHQQETDDVMLSMCVVCSVYCVSLLKMIELLCFESRVFLSISLCVCSYDAIFVYNSCMGTTNASNNTFNFFVAAEHLYGKKCAPN